MPKQAVPFNSEYVGLEDYYAGSDTNVGARLREGSAAVSILYGALLLTGERWIRLGHNRPSWAYDLYMRRN